MMLHAADLVEQGQWVDAGGRSAKLFLYRLVDSGRLQ